MDVYEILKEKGIQLPPVPKPVASYEPAIIYKGMVFCSGQTGTIDQKLKYQGKVGGEISIIQGKESARIAVLNCLSAVESVIGDLNKINRIIRLTGYVASEKNFNNQPEVIEGASSLLLEIFGEKGKHSRSAIGVSELPSNAPVEIELIVGIKEEEK